jgi:hypothetical protein
MAGDFKSEEKHAMKEMQHHLSALSTDSDKVLTLVLKETSIKIGVVTVF